MNSAIVTVTEIESFRRCGWQHEFNSKSRLGLESANPLRSLYLGTLWHKVMDSLAQKQRIKQLGEHAFARSPEEKIETCVHIYPNGALCSSNVYSHMNDPFLANAGALTMKVKDHYKTVMGIEATQYELAETYKTIETCKTMLDAYLAYYNGHLIPEEFEYVQTEQQFYREIPGTEHCECYFHDKCQCQMLNPKTGKPMSCRYKHGHYTQCKCLVGDVDVCGLCRPPIILEGTLDGLIQHRETQELSVLENKTFSVHPNIDELHRVSQFMGYMWIGGDFDVKQVLYNGVYTKLGGKSNLPGFVRVPLDWRYEEINEWVKQLAIDSLRLFDPTRIPTRTIPPVGGCNGVNNCGYKRLCDARFAHKNDYNQILDNEFRKRE